MKNNDSKKRILITGGAGFIGSHLCDRYTKEGHTILCLDNFLTGNLVNIRHLLSCSNFKLINGDIRDSELLEKLMPGVDYIIHLAAQIHVDRSIIEPKLTLDTNVLGTLNVLEAGKRYDVRKIIHTSTSEVYGSAKVVPMSENHPLDAPHPYGASKIAADRLCYAYNHTYGMNIQVMRPFNIFGPRQRDSGYGGVISIFIRRVLNNMPPIIYGDGNQSRDYTYINDLVRAYDLVLNYNDVLEEPINFGTGNEVKIIDLANDIIELCGKKGSLRPVHIEPRAGEIQRLISDASKAKKILGWEPKYTIKEGLKEFIEWYKGYRFEEWTKPG
jgi:UDP-glucose 4-epimerase